MDQEIHDAVKKSMDSGQFDNLSIAAFFANRYEIGIDLSWECWMRSFELYFAFTDTSKRADILLDVMKIMEDIGQERFEDLEDYNSKKRGFD